MYTQKQLNSRNNQKQKKLYAQRRKASHRLYPQVYLGTFPPSFEQLNLFINVHKITWCDRQEFYYFLRMFLGDLISCWI